MFKVNKNVWVKMIKSKIIQNQNQTLDSKSESKSECDFSSVFMI